MRRDAWLLLPIALLALRLEVGPDVYDSGELAAAATLLGASHPPGQPLHALLGHAVSFVPLGSIPFRLAALSLACEGLAAYLVLRIARRVCAGGGRASELAPYAAALCALLAPPLLRQAVRIEVYGPALAVALFGVHEALGALDRRPGAIPRACLAAGLAATLHPPHLVAPLAMVAVVVIAERGAVLRARGFWISIALLGVGGLAAVYLPLRAHAGAPMWGDPRTLSGFLEYVSASAYRQNLTTRTGLTPALVGRWLEYAARSVSILPVLGVVFALAPRAFRNSSRFTSATLDRGVEMPRPLVLLSIAAPIALLAAMIQPLEERNPDNVAYAAPAVGMLCAAGAAALGRALDRARPAIAGLALFVLASNPFALGMVAERTTAAPPALESLAAVLVESPGTRALVVVESDFVAAAIMMAQAVDGARPDVAPFVTGLATSSWHWRTLAAHPAFDGRPARGPGASPREAYPRGAVALARDRVPLAVEPAWLEPEGASVDGAFAVFPPRREAASTRRALANVTVEAREVPLGDADAAGAVVRNAVVQRAVRLMRDGREPEALRWLDRLLFWLPGREREILRVGDRAGDHVVAPWIRDPRAYLVGREDVVRATAVVLAGGGQYPTGAALARAQATRDPLGWIQLGALELAAGDRDGAFRAFDRAVAADPSLAPMARAVLDAGGVSR